MLKRALLVFTLVAGTLLTLFPTQQAEAYWGSRRWQDHSPSPRSTYRFRPRFALSLTGGVHFVDTYSDIPGVTFGFGILELGGHLWVNPHLSLDLALGTHLAMDNYYENRWGYVSFKPGIRARFGWFYLRAALDLAIGEAIASTHQGPVLFGFLVGLGVRIPISRLIRLIGEIDYQFMFANVFFMPFYGKIGVEFVF